MSTAHIERMSLTARRVLALGLLAVLAFVFAFWMVLPAFRWATGAMEDLADARFALARATRASPIDAARLGAQAEAVHQEISGQLVAGPKDSDAAGAFQARVSQTLAAQGLIVETMAARALSGQGPLRKLSLDWRGTGTETALVAALATLESSRPLMRVERIDVQRRQPAADDGRLVVELRIVAYWAAVNESPAGVAKAPR